MIGGVKVIDPTDITNYYRTQAELEEFILFCVAVGGKTASIIAKQLNEFLIHGEPGQTAFQIIRNYNEKKLLEMLKKSKLGKYKLLTRSFSQLAYSNINLKSCLVEELEKFPGIGPKTSRYFVLHTRPNVKIACIDTHVKKWLRNKGYTSNKYEELERAFIDEADKMGMDYATLDLKIWNEFSIRSGKNKII